MLLYYLSWSWLYGTLLEKARLWIESQISTTEWSNFIHYILVGLLVFCFWIIISWTFTLFVSIISSPFNDIISRRTEHVLRGCPPERGSESFKLLCQNLWKTIFNEFKKILAIIGFTIISIVMGWVPILIPVAILLSALLMAASFLDYSWSRHDMSFMDCLTNIRQLFFSCFLSGFFFLFLVSIPIVNLFVLPYGTIYFTIMFNSSYFRESG